MESKHRTQGAAKERKESKERKGWRGRVNEIAVELHKSNEEHKCIHSVCELPAISFVVRTVRPLYDYHTKWDSLHKDLPLLSPHP